FVQRLRELGWIEARTIAIEVRWTEGRSERAAEIAAELVRLKVDVIVTSGTPQVAAAKQTTSVIPIVFALAGDPVGTGLVASLARPGGATSQVYRFWRPTSLARGSNCYARLSLVSAVWRLWAMPAIPSLWQKWASFRRQRTRSASDRGYSKSGERRISRPPSRQSRAARKHFMSVKTCSRLPIELASTH